MALKEQIQNDLKAALLGGNRFEGDTLRVLKAAILNEEVVQNRRDEGLTDVEVEQVVVREVKKRHESVKLYEQNDRPELADDEKKEIAILEKYLPQQLPEAQVTAVIEQTINEMGATGMQSMGMVIKSVKDKVGNTADGATVARIVKEKLST